MRSLMRHTHDTEAAGVGAGEPAQHRLQHAAVREVAHVDLPVQARDRPEPALAALLVANGAPSAPGVVAGLRRVR